VADGKVQSSKFKIESRASQMSTQPQPAAVREVAPNFGVVSPEGLVVQERPEGGPEAPTNPDGPVEEPPSPDNSPGPVEEPPGTGDAPTKEPPAGPDEVDPPINDPRVPGQPGRKQVD
jgi:hypothetical protein